MLSAEGREASVLVRVPCALCSDDGSGDVVVTVAVEYPAPHAPKVRKW